MPLWELTSKLTSLSIAYGYSSDLDSYMPRSIPEGEEVVEVSEEAFLSFELPPPSAPLPSTHAEINALHKSVIARTVATAARNGHLKHLAFEKVGDGFPIVQVPFAVPSLLPRWVGIESWGGRTGRWTSFILPEEKWHATAASLRPLLAHASIWLPTSSGEERANRLLAGLDVQGLAEHFDAGLPKVIAFRSSSTRTPGRLEPSYLRWLAEDAELAQQIADAWNAVVTSRAVDIVKCACRECKAQRGEPSAEAEEE